jgi:hypothetical protein
VGSDWTREIALYSASSSQKLFHILTRRDRRIYQMMNSFADLNPFERESGELNVITDTPKR